MSPIYQVLLGLRFLATGHYYESVGDTLRSCKTSVHDAVHDFVGAVCDLSDAEISFPTGDALTKVQETFYQIGGIPRVCGLVDGTLIKIRKPGKNTADYICRKGYAAINVQVNKLLLFKAHLIQVSVSI